MNQYLELMRDVLENGTDRDDRTGTGTRSVFGRQIRFDLSKGFPLLTTKKVHTKSIIYELLWFLSGSTNNNWLKEKGVSIWDEWAAPDGNLGPIYGEQWRSWKTIDSYDYSIDQIDNLVSSIRENPNSRRLIVSAWNPSVLPCDSLSPQENAEIGLAALPPCHTLFQFYVSNGRLSCQLYQRSADLFLGVPFNIASYALLTHMVAHQCDLDVGDFVHTFGDVHLYQDHIQDKSIVEEQLSREPRALPTLSFARKPRSIFDYQFEDVVISGYEPHAFIKAEVSV